MSYRQSFGAPPRVIVLTIAGSDYRFERVGGQPGRGQFEGQVGRWRVDDAWEIAINPHDTEIEATVGDKRMGAPVPPFAVAVWFNGWWAGTVTPVGGWLAAGEAANEATFLAALKAGAPA